MAIFPLFLEQPLADACRGGVITLGNFDGVHLGHRALLAETVRQAKERDLSSVAVTFDPHPLEVLRPESFQPVLTTLPHRVELIQAAGIIHVAVIQTTSAFLRLGADDFFQKIVLDLLAAAAVVEGWNFCFGKGREGTTQTLEDLGRASGVGVTVVPPREVNDRLVSSSRVRQDLLAGDVADAALLLGRPYRLEGRVERGQQRGRTIGFPTANLFHVPTLIPGDGVYAAIAYHNGKAWPAAANIGPNPTFGEQGHKLEVHLLGFQGNLYGQMLTVDFLERIRATHPFADVQELIAQIRKDSERAENIATAFLQRP